MKWFFNSVLLIIISSGLAACNYNIVKGDRDSENLMIGTLSENEKLTMMNYEYISTRIISLHCTSCHGSSGNVNLETYENLVANLDGIKRTVFQIQSMPKRGSLTIDEKKLLYNWIELGAPQFSAASPPTVSDPLIATYASINKKIFEAKCISCHNPTGAGKRILFDLQSLLNSPLELIIPQNADESGLVVALERQDDKRMPPAKEGFAELKLEEKTAIRKWIDAGAKD